MDRPAGRETAQTHRRDDGADLVILDINLPGVDGLPLVRALLRRRAVPQQARHGFGRVEFDPGARQLFCDGADLDLPRREVSVCECLLLAVVAAEVPRDPYYYIALYQGEAVRVLRFQDVTVISSGVVVWFGVGLGLRPLLDLESAIARRSPTELEPIRRAVPVEAKGIVQTRNRLLDRISRRISSKDEFISSAAHQLRNPVAGLLARAEAVENAPTPDVAKRRSSELVQAAREACALINKLLSFERANGINMRHSGEVLCLAGNHDA